MFKVGIAFRINYTSCVRVWQLRNSSRCSRIELPGQERGATIWSQQADKVFLHCECVSVCAVLAVYGWWSCYNIVSSCRPIYFPFQTPLNPWQQVSSQNELTVVLSCDWVHDRTNPSPIMYAIFTESPLYLW